MAERPSSGNVAAALQANAIATGAGLIAFILMFGTISGAHFNPVVTLSEAVQRNVPACEVASLQPNCWVRQRPQPSFAGCILQFRRMRRLVVRWRPATLTNPRLKAKLEELERVRYAPVAGFAGAVPAWPA